jgi:hypothetical protein
MEVPGGEVQLLLIHDLGTRRPGRTSPPGKGPLVPTAQEAGWASDPVWTQKLEEKSLASAWERTSIAWSTSL